MRNLRAGVKHPFRGDDAGRASRRAILRSVSVRPLPAAVFVGALVAFIAWPGRAHAQVHWDASLQAGAGKRFLADRPSGAPDSTLGPSAQLATHLALLPLLRGGVYAGYELSPSSSGPARHLGSGGLHLRILSPWPRGAVHAWISTGFGASVAGAGAAGGGFLEVPFAIGAAYRVWKPWELFVELGGKAGFAHGGSLYRDDGGPAAPRKYMGSDSFALGLSLGVLVDM